MPYDRNLPYNELPLLPPPEDKVVTIEILSAVNNANKALAELKGLARTLPNQSMLLNILALREAKASSEIENIFTTDDELYKALAGNDIVLNGNAKEVLRYRQALWLGFNSIKGNSNFNTDLFVKIYQEIKEVNDGIRPFQTETTIKKRGSGSLGGNVVYTPPRGNNVIQSKLDNLLIYMNDDHGFPIDPLIKLAVSHYQFEAIHPFRDGNGRTGRILSILLMIQKGLLDIPILYLSAYIIENKDNYYHYLNGVTALGNWRNWILYMLTAVEETSLFTIQKINEINSLFLNTYELIQLNLPHIRKETIEKIFEQPYLSPKRLIGKDIKSINTAKKYLSQLENMGVMSSAKIGKETIYLNIDLFNLLSEI